MPPTVRTGDKAKSTKPSGVKPRSDIYVALLVISLLAQVAGAAFLYYDMSQYPERKPPQAPSGPSGAGAGGGNAPIPAGPGNPGPATGPRGGPGTPATPPAGAAGAQGNQGATGAGVVPPGGKSAPTPN